MHRNDRHDMGTVGDPYLSGTTARNQDPGRIQDSIKISENFTV